MTADRDQHGLTPDDITRLLAELQDDEPQEHASEPDTTED